jgi:hypothetical protein
MRDYNINLMHIYTLYFVNDNPLVSCTSSEGRVDKVLFDMTVKHGLNTHMLCLYIILQLDLLFRVSFILRGDQIRLESTLVYIQVASNALSLCGDLSFTLPQYQ